MSELTAERANELFSYDPDTGALTWKIDASRKFKAGTLAGTARPPDGRRIVCVNYRRHYAYRIIWLMTHGEWPSGEVDHINGDPADNRLTNLRAVPRNINRQNERRARKDSKTGILGVSPSRGKFAAYIEVDGINKGLGRFATPEQAHAAYVAAKRQLHIGCTI